MTVCVSRVDRNRSKLSGKATRRNTNISVNIEPVPAVRYWSSDLQIFRKLNIAASLFANSQATVKLETGGVETLSSREGGGIGNGH